MKRNYLLNAIIGDVAGSIYEWSRIKTKPKELISTECKFTDDTVHTIAVSDAIMNNPDNPDFARYLRMWSRLYPRSGYGKLMRKWINSDNMGPYGSYGNGSAMRVSACGYLPPIIDQYGLLCLLNYPIVEKSAAVTHNHPEGIKGAIVVAGSIAESMNRIKLGLDPKEMIKLRLGEFYPNYDLSISLDERRPSYKFDSTCQGSVPQSIQCVLEAEDYEDAIKLAISMGGDADTMACIAGSIAGVIWKKPDYLVDWVRELMTSDMLEVIDNFDKFVNDISSI